MAKIFRCEQCGTFYTEAEAKKKKKCCDQELKEVGSAGCAGCPGCM